MPLSQDEGDTRKSINQSTNTQSVGFIGSCTSLNCLTMFSLPLTGIFQGLGGGGGGAP